MDATKAAVLARFKPNDRIQQILEETETCEDKIWSLAEEVIELGKADGLWYRLQIHPKRVGVHRHNRGGWMCCGVDALDTGVGIDSIGFSWKACEDAQCFEDSPEHINEQAFLYIVEQDEMLADYKPGDIDYASVACSHSNQFFAMLIDEKPCSIPEVSINGKLNKSKFIQNNPRSEKVFTDGMWWTAWKWEAEVLYPKLPAMLEKAFNKKASIYRQESSFQLFNRAMTQAVVQQRPWADIETNLQKIQPKTPKEEISGIVNFAKRWGGSDKKLFVEPLLAFVKSFVPVDKVMGSIWEDLASLQLIGDNECVYFVYGMLKVNASSKDKKHPLNRNEIHSVQTTLLKPMHLANSIMHKCRQLVLSHGPVAQDLTKLYGRLDTQAVRFTFKKPLAEQFEIVEHIGSKFVHDLQDILQINSIKSPFAIKKAGEEDTCAPAASKPKSTMLEIGPDGAQVNVKKVVVIQKGYDIDMHVQSKEGHAHTYAYIYICYTHQYQRVINLYVYIEGESKRANSTCQVSDTRVWYVYMLHVY